MSSLGASTAVFDLQLPEDLPDGKPDLKKQRFFKVDVSKTEQVAAAVHGVVAWSKETNKPVAAVVCCAGFLGPAKVDITHFFSIHWSTNHIRRFSPRATVLFPWKSSKRSSTSASQAQSMSSAKSSLTCRLSRPTKTAHAVSSSPSPQPPPLTAKKAKFRTAPPRAP